MRCWGISKRLAGSRSRWRHGGAAAGLQSTWGGGAWAGPDRLFQKRCSLGLRSGDFSRGCAISWTPQAPGHEHFHSALRSLISEKTAPPSTDHTPALRPPLPAWKEPVLRAVGLTWPAPFSLRLVLRNLLLRPLKELLATRVTESKLTLLATPWANESEKRGAEARKRR